MGRFAPTDGASHPAGAKMETKVENPALVDEFETDGRGRVRLGSRFANSKVKVVVSDVRELEEDNHD